MIKGKIGTWLITDTYVDKETKFLLTESHMYYGTLSEAMDDYAHHFTTQDLRFQFYSPNDETPKE